MSPPPAAAPVTSLDFDAVTAREVSRTFGRRRAVNKISFTAARGQIVGVLGPNGAGKSTLLGVLSTLLSPTSGTVAYGDVAGKVDAAALRARIGVLGHDLFLYPELTARENLLFFAGLYGVAGAATQVATALETAGLTTRAEDPASAYSRGMRQRLALERALIHQPRLVLLDEPFTGLDDASASAFVARLRGLRAEGRIVILATHDLDLADGLLDQALFLRDGRVVHTATSPERLRATYQDVVGR